MLPAILLLLLAVLFVPGNSGRGPAALQAVAPVSAAIDPSRLTEMSPPCLIEALYETDRVSVGAVQFLFRLSEGLNRLSGDASELLDWIESAVNEDGLEGIEGLVDSMAAWLASGLDWRPPPHDHQAHEPPVPGPEASGDEGAGTPCQA